MQKSKKMKLSLKDIVWLVVCTLIIIFSYQAHWLMSVYHTQKEQVELHVLDAMIGADISEMMLRLDKMKVDMTKNGSIDVSTGFADNGDTVVTEVKTVYQAKDTTLLMNHQSLIYQNSYKLKKNDSTTVNAHVAAIMDKEKSLNLNMKDFKDMSTNIRRALHSGLDNISKVDIHEYDSILNKQLYMYNLYRPHRIQLVYFKDSLLRKYSVVAKSQTTGYQPSKKAKTYTYFTDINSMLQYRLTMEPVTFVVLRQMAGILTASLFTLLILIGTFVYLIRTLWKQKTLDEMKSDFTNNITHELKTPIAIAYAANDAMLNFNVAENPEKAKEYLNISQEQLKRLGDMVEQILSASMEQRKNMEIHKEEVSIKEIVQTLASQYRLKTEKPLKITTEIVPENLTIQADRIHFYHIMSNLMDNAIKYSRENVDIHISAHESPDHQTIEINVKDNGIGIPVDKQKYIFDKFYRVPNGNLHDVKGYGLGLYYVKQIMEKHQGTITVYSEPNQCTIFTLHFQTNGKD